MILSSNPLKVFFQLFIFTAFITLSSCKEEKKQDSAKTETETTSTKKESAYPHGLLPQDINLKVLDTVYSKWKAKYITSNGCPVGKRVLFDDMKHTVSEGIAYGLLASAFMKDESLFDDLLLYYQNYLNHNGLMNWKIDDKGELAGENAATDADEDVAFALLVAHSQISTNKGYRKEALRIIDAMLKFMVEQDTYVLKAGDEWGGSNTTNPSYFAPGYYKLFAKVSGNNDWLKVSDKCYDILNNCMNKETGLVPDWCKASGELPADRVTWSRDNGTTFNYDAIRTPWRISMDYLWTGDERAYKYCNTIARFIDSIGVKNINDGYKLNGEVTRDRHTSTFVGCFGVGIMASDNKYQTLVNEAYTENIVVENDNYFNETLKVIMLMGQSGVFKMPDEFYN